jgi:oligopeptide transport system substrate-binding protein
LRRHLPISLALAGIVLSLAACGDRNGELIPPGERRPQPVELVLREDDSPDPAVLAAEQVVHRGNGQEPETLDPHLAADVSAAQILRDLFEGLTTEAPDGELLPGVALRWNISRDARTYTFYLRRGLTWSNGDPLTAGDFLFSLRRAADPRTAASAATMLLPILNAREVLAGDLPVEELGVALLDEYTLQITLTGPTPYFLGLLNHPIAFPVNRRNIEEHGDEFARPGTLISNGAFVLSRWVPRVQIVLEKNPRYREAALTLVERVHYYPIEDHSTEVKAFRAGEIDWTNEVPNNQFKWLQQHYPDELVVSPWMGSYFFGFNLTREPFVDNPSLRMALLLAIDRRILTDKVAQFGEQPSFSLVPPGMDGYVPFSPEYADWSQEERNHEALRLMNVDFLGERRRVEIRYNTSENHKKMAGRGLMWKRFSAYTRP